MKERNLFFNICQRLDICQSFGEDATILFNGFIEVRYLGHRAICSFSSFGSHTRSAVPNILPADHIFKFGIWSSFDSERNKNELHVTYLRSQISHIRRCFCKMPTSMSKMFDIFHMFLKHDKLFRSCCPISKILHSFLVFV